jgi:hypothetical protein
MWVKQIVPGGNDVPNLYEMVPALNLIVVAIYVLLPVALWLEKSPLKVYKYLILYPLFMLSWWPITSYAFFTQKNKTWSHTQHTRSIRLEEVQSRHI